MNNFYESIKESNFMICFNMGKLLWNLKIIVISTENYKRFYLLKLRRNFAIILVNDFHEYMLFTEIINLENYSSVFLLYYHDHGP